MFDFDSLNFDLDGDGILDSVGVDTDGDGILDSFFTDSNGDGIMDTVFSDGDGDGILDTIGEDADGNGVYETWHATLDTNGDGFIDTIIDSYDYNQDGAIDSQTTMTDTNFDGAFDETIKAVDTNLDGLLDDYTTYSDYNQDGIEDEVINEQFLDLDDDGVIDAYVMNVDLDGDGVFETVGVYNVDEETGMIDAEPVYVENMGIASNDLDNFDPSEADMDSVTGNPEESMEHWEYQGDTGRCALYSQKFVIEELTGKEIDIEELADFAEENGWFTEEGGTPFINMNKVLDYFGIENDMSFHNDASDLEDALEAGKKIIVSVDADEIWHGESDDLFTPGDGANHAVEVIGIDHSDEDNPMVILNDSGTPDGCGEMVPLDTFMDAWEDGNYQMISCI